MTLGIQAVPANGSGEDGDNAYCEGGVGKRAPSTQLASCVEKGEGMAGAILRAYALLAPNVVGLIPTSAIANSA